LLFAAFYVDLVSQVKADAAFLMWV